MENPPRGKICFSITIVPFTGFITRFKGFNFSILMNNFGFWNHKVRIIKFYGRVLRNGFEHKLQ